MGFDGQQKENNLYGIGNHNTAMFWEYDTRLGRRWNLDPKWNEWESTYACFGGNPILHSDVNGDTWKDKVMGSLIGAATNLIPGGALSDWRDRYTPEDAADYNRTLRSSDQAAVALGIISIEAGTGLMESGAVLTETVVGAEVGVPTVVTGAAAAAFGASTSMNGAVNMAKGYNRGNKVQTEKQSAEQIQNRQAASQNDQPKAAGSNSSSRTSNKLEENKEAVGDHTVFKRGGDDGKGKIYKYETYKKTNKGFWDPRFRYDGGKPDGSPGAPHKGVPTPHVQGKDVPERIRPAKPSEIPKN